MRIAVFAVKVGLLVAIALAPACGGGGGGGAPPAPRVIAALQAALLGSNELQVEDADARGAIVVEIMSDGELTFAAAAQAAWVGDINGMHIHRGAAGVNGGIEVDLLSGGATFDPGTLAASDTLTIGAALAQEIANNPGDFYVNIHTTAAINGLVRAQLGDLVTLEWHTVMLGTEETPTVIDASARGAATFRVTGVDTVEYAIAMVSPPITDITFAHIHVGAQGSAPGGIVIDLGTPAGVVDVAAGTLTGTATMTFEQLARVLGDVPSFYCNVHTAAAPAGIARGQLDQGAVGMWAPLAGDEVVAPTDPAARGGVTLEFTTVTSGTATLAVQPSFGINNVAAAHLHIGDPGVEGTSLIDLRGGADFTFGIPNFSGNGTITYTQAEFTRLLAQPDAFYVQLYGPGPTDGLVRGQLTRDPMTFFSALRGDEATTVVDGNASGAVNVVVTGVHECSFQITMVSPVVADVTAAFLKDGAPLVDGPHLIDFLTGTFEVSGSSITGDVSFTGRTFARLLAAPDQLYCDVHTAAQPVGGPGIARGQAVLIAGDIPPAGLTYSSPVVVYETGAPITTNLPSSVGGAVSSYSVSPALPNGLVLDTVTGVISGTPIQVAAAADYTVTASNAVGSDTFDVNITVNLGPPLSLSYPTPPTYVVGTQITPLTPARTGGAISNYSDNPTLPQGLALNATTGVISGTPQAAASLQGYTITGSNTAGMVTAVVNIRVDAALQPPTNLSYTSPVSYKTGFLITNNTPTISGGAVATWSINPALPQGLDFNTSSGVISGTPTTVTSAQNYRVTAANAAGSTFFDVNISVPLGEPKIDSYSNANNIGSPNTPIAQMSPTLSGGAVASWSVSPALPTGISIDTSGVITGMTSGTTATPVNYTVTATNAAGSSNYTVSIWIY